MDDLKPSKQKITWQALEFKAHKKSTAWYVGFVIIAVGLIVYGIYTHNFLTTFTFFILAGAWLIFAVQTPRIINHELGVSGVKVNQSFFPYKNIKKFWLIYTNENKTLNFETTAYLNNQISLQLGNQHPNEIKSFLKQYLQEDMDKEESLTDVIARKIKF